MSGDSKILVGEIAAAQGMKGEVRVHTFTENPADLADFPDLKLRFVRAAGPNVGIYKMDGVENRTDAESLRGTELYVNRAALPKLKAGEHYVADLIGMKIAGSEARVAYVHNFGAGDILELDSGEMIVFNGALVNYEEKEIKL
ncbi:MAG: ribosome maturation factor RimM [Rickettsiales bacterium]|jgi:16S rRNA processing protein RimM|nr:ribosome maturation factor RimM [Rickettsiales bacterium]